MFRYLLESRSMKYCINGTISYLYITKTHNSSWYTISGRYFKVRFTMLTSTLSMWIFRIGFSYILAIYFNMGILGTWIAMCIDWFCRGACFVIRFARGKWKNISFIDN